jgi:hypothetical protein
MLSPGREALAPDDAKNTDFAPPNHTYFYVILALAVWAGGASETFPRSV